MSLPPDAFSSVGTQSSHCSQKLLKDMSTSLIFDLVYKTKIRVIVSININKAAFEEAEENFTPKRSFRTSTLHEIKSSFHVHLVGATEVMVGSDYGSRLAGFQFFVPDPPKSVRPLDMVLKSFECHYFF